MTGTIARGSRGRLVAGLIGLVACAGMLALAAPAPAQGAQTIKIVRNGNNLLFKGAKAVRSGAQLRIVNKTKPNQVGPHTLSVVKKSLLPRTGKQIQRCFDEGRICFDVAVAHEFDFDTGVVNEPLVDVGLEGWNRPFKPEAEGDSWYTETKDEVFRQVVSAQSGRTLHYFCAVHPFMQGKLEVR